MSRGRLVTGARGVAAGCHLGSVSPAAMAPRGPVNDGAADGERRRPSRSSWWMPVARRSAAQLRVEAGGLAREVVAFREAGRRSGGFGVEPGSGRGVTVALVQVR